jgi:hypothetical protein
VDGSSTTVSIWHAKGVADVILYEKLQQLNQDYRLESKHPGDEVSGGY